MAAAAAGIARLLTKAPIAPVAIDLPAAALGVVARKRPDAPERRFITADAVAQIRL